MGPHGKKYKSVNEKFLGKIYKKYQSGSSKAEIEMELARMVKGLKKKPLCIEMGKKQW